MSFYNSYSFLKKIDKLLIGPQWKCSIINIIGDRLDEDRNPENEHLELWHHDPLECVKALIGNPAFKDFILYVPERVYIDDEGKVRRCKPAPGGGIPKYDCLKQKKREN